MKTSFNTTKTLPTMLAIIVGSTLALSGCQATSDLFSKRNDGSLNYQQSQKLAPLQLPTDQNTAPFVPLYATPNVGTNTLVLQNEAGKQFQLPKPERSVAVISVVK